ncbi:hypothetical protein GCM10027054_24420 [Isoptericola nanjingensis]
MRKRRGVAVRSALAGWGTVADVVVGVVRAVMTGTLGPRTLRPTPDPLRVRGPDVADRARRLKNSGMERAW